MSLSQLYSTVKNFLFEPCSPLSLCTFRILFGLVLLEYCVLLGPELITGFSDTNGILRIQTLDKIFGIPVINLLVILPHNDIWLIGFYIVFVITCLCVTLGLFSRINIVIVYLGLVSLLHRNIFVHHSGDHLLTIAAFFMMFAPIDAALSLDRLLRKKSDCPEKRSLWAMRAYQLQFALIYWQTSWAKLASPSWWDGTALYYVFRHIEFSRFYVPIIPQSMFLMKLLTWGTMVIEFSAWIFIWFKETRYFVLSALLMLHLGIDYAMNIPIFEHIMIASLVVFIPPEDLEKALNKLKSWFGR